MADIQLGGSVGTTGTAILGRAFVNYATDADHTLTVTEYTNQFLTLTSSGSLTVQHNLIAPLTRGQTFIVQNITSGGQSIQVQGVTGTGVVINNGTTTAVVCDGTNYIPLSPANIIAVDAGQVDFTTQPVINTPNAGTHLELDQDFPAMILDGTYGNGTQAWQGGVWILLGHSLIRVASRDSTIPILRIPLPIGFQPIVNRNMQWDKSGNRIYIYDRFGRVIVVDTTPAVDPSGQYVGGCPGVISVLDLTATAVAGQTFVSFVADTVLQYYWFFILGTTTAYRVQFNGANFTTLTLPHNAGDGIFANSQIWSAGYTGTDHYVSQYSPTGTALHDLLINSTAGGTYLDIGGMAYDATNSIVWTYSNGSTNLVVGVQVSPSVSILHSWSPYLNSAFAQNGLNVLASGQVFAPTFAGNFIYDADGTMASGTGGSINANDFSVAENTRYVYAFAHNSYLTTYDIVFFSNSADGWLLQTTNPIQNVIVHINPFVFLGGAQRWVAGGGETMGIVALEMGQANLNPFGDTASTLSFGPPTALSGIPSVTGKQAVISGPDSGFFLISGLTELGTISTGIVGPFLGFLTISGAANDANNGTFIVQNLGGGPFFTSLHVRNTSGVFPDANSGNITWTYSPEYEIIFEIKGNFGMKFLNFSQVPNITTAHSVRVLTASGTDLELLPYLQQSLTLLLYWDGTSPTLSCTPIVSTKEQTYYQGTVDPFEGQPITNLPGDGKFLTSLNDNPSQVIDGTYGRDVTGPLILPLPTSAAPWQSGVWTLTNHSIVRNVSTDPDIPALHIPLPEGFIPLTKSDGYVGRTFQWDQPNNRMYVFDTNGPKIYTIDTTPTLDVTKSYIESVPGIINIQDLSVYGPAAFTVGAGVGTYMAFAVDLVNFVYWVFSVSLSNQLTTTLIPFAFPIGDAGGNNSQIINYGPQTDINGPVQSFDAMYVKDLGVYVTLLSSNGDAQIALASPGGIPVFIATISSGLFDQVGYMAFDPNATPSPIIWMASNVGTGTVWGFDGGSFIYGPWSPGSAPSGVITVMNNDNILIPLVADNVTEFTNVGASVTTISYPVGFTSNSNFGYAVAHDGYNYLYASNNTNGYLDQAIVGTNNLTDWLFVGGQQQWVGASSTGSNSVIFQPGGTASEATFTNFTTLCSYIAGFNSFVAEWTIYLDGSFAGGTVTIPAGTYPLPKEVTFKGIGTLLLALSPDVIFNPPPESITFENVTVSTSNATSPVITVPNATNLNLDILGVGTLNNTGSEAFIEVSSGGTLTGSVRDSGILVNPKVININGGTGQLSFLNHAQLNGSSIQIVTGTFTVQLDSSAGISPTYYLTSGLTIQFLFAPDGTVLYNSGGTSNDKNIFSDFGQLCGYIAAVGPLVDAWTIGMLSGGGSPVISPATYALPANVTFTTTAGTNSNALTLSDVVFDPPPVLFTIDNLAVICDSSVNPCFHVQASTGPMYFFMRGEFAQVNCTGTQPFISDDDTSLSVSMKDQAFLTGSTPVIHFGATADGFFKMYDQSKIALLSSLDLTAGAAVTITADSGVTLSSPAPAGITITFVDNAFQMVYTPTTLADWSGTSPTSIGDALDRIAAKITPIP